MKDTYMLTVDDQIIAKSRWDLAAMASCPNCKGCIRECHMAIADGEWGIDAALACNYECEKLYKRRVLWLWDVLRVDEDLFDKEFPVYSKKQRFSHELQQILWRLRSWDPNGDWDEWDVLATPLQTMEIVEEAMAELAADYQDVPGWMSTVVDLLMLFC